MKKLIIAILIFFSQIGFAQKATQYYSQSQPDTATYIREYQDVLDYAAANSITAPSDRIKIIQNKQMRSLVDSGVYAHFNSYELGAGIYVMNGDPTVTKAFMGINWIDPDTLYATEIGGNITNVPYYGLTNPSSSNYFDPNYIFKTSDTAFIYNNFSIGAMVTHANKATGGGVPIGGRTGSGAGDVQSILIERVFLSIPRMFNLIGGDNSATNGRMRVGSLLGGELPTLLSIHRNAGDTVQNYIGATPDNLVDNPTNVLPSREGKITFMALASANYSNNADTSNPDSYSYSKHFTDTLTHVFIGPNTEEYTSAMTSIFNQYNGEIAALNDTINVMRNFYLQETSQNTLLPILPRYNDQFGMEFQLPRNHPDSIKIWRVTSTAYEGEGTLRTILLDSVQNNGKYDIICVMVSGLCYNPLEVFEATVINEDHGIIIYGQFAPAQGYRLHGTELNVRSGPMVIQHMRFGAGTDTLAGVARDSIITPNGWTQYSERDAIKANADYFVLDHCTVNFSTDELLQSRGSYQSYTYNLFTKPLAYNFHHKGAHPKGTIHFKQAEGEGRELAWWRNAYISTKDRMPQIGGQVFGVLQENYGYDMKFGTQIVKGNTFVDDTLGGMSCINGNHLYYDFYEKFAFRFSAGLTTSGASYFDTFDLEGTIYPDPFAIRCAGSEGKIIFGTGAIGTECSSGIVRDSFLVSEPVRAYKAAPLLPNYLARKHITTFAGAMPQNPDTLEATVRNEVFTKQRIPPPEDMSYWLPLLQSEMPTQLNTMAFPDDSLQTDSTGYLGIERLADSLHWRATYPDSIPWPGIEADPTGAFLWDMDSPFILPQHKENNLTAYKEEEYIC